MSNLVSILESFPNTIGSGPAQVGATAAIAAGFTKPFFAARTAIVAACPPPKSTKSSSVPHITSQLTTMMTMINDVSYSYIKSVPILDFLN